MYNVFFLTLEVTRPPLSLAVSTCSVPEQERLTVTELVDDTTIPAWQWGVSVCMVIKKWLVQIYGSSTFCWVDVIVASFLYLVLVTEGWHHETGTWQRGAVYISTVVNSASMHATERKLIYRITKNVRISFTKQSEPREKCNLRKIQTHADRGI